MNLFKQLFNIALSLPLMGETRWQIAQFFELRWWRGYLKKKSPQDYLKWKRGYWLGFMEQLDIPIENIKELMIDIGCGPAGIFTIFSAKKMVALDPLLTKYASLDIFSQEAYPAIDFVNQSFEDYKNEAEFKTIFCLNAINHFKDLKGSFKKLRKIAAEDGQLILSVDAHNHAIFRWLFALLPLDILHPHQYYLKEYEELLLKAGFQVDKKVLIKKEFFFDYWVFVAKAT